MVKLAIKGHTTRYEDVIEILKMLGGKNKNYNRGLSPNKIYVINDFYHIDQCDPMRHPEYYQFSVEEFFEKFPYKIGDKVIAYVEGNLAQFTIQDIRWNNKLNKIEYKICSSWCDASLMQPYKEEIKDKALSEDLGGWECNNGELKSNTLHISKNITSIEVPEGTTIESFTDGVIYFKHLPDIEN